MDACRRQQPSLFQIARWPYIARLHSLFEGQVNVRRAIVFIVDGVSAGFLGCYGNSWLGTPAIDDLASQSYLFEQCLTELPDPLQYYPSLLRGTHPLAPPSEFAICDALNAEGIPLHFLTDDHRLTALREVVDFSSLETLPEPSEATAESAESTNLARFASVLLDWLDEPPTDEIVIAHAQGMLGPWDAPYDLRSEFADEEDPAPPDFVKPPFERENREIDSDHILGITQAYAGQISVLDMIIGELLAAIEELPDEQQPVFIFSSMGGFPLGLRGQVGREVDSPLRLYSDTLHVPLMLRTPAAADQLVRAQGLVTLGDIFPSLLRRWEIDPPPDASIDLWGMDHSGRRHVLALLEDQRCFRTSHWSIRYHLPTDEQAISDQNMGSILPELFVKPDDRWEVSNIADRCPNIAEIGKSTAHQTEVAIRADEEPEELPDDLKKPVL